MRYLLVAALLGSAAVLMVGCGKTPDPTARPAPPEPDATQAKSQEAGPAAAGLPSTPASPAGIAPGDEDLSKVTPSCSMRCQEWREAVADPADREKYKGKVIELVGRVNDLSHTDKTPFDTSLYINDPNPTNGIGVHAVVKGKDAWKVVLPGQTVTVRGRYSPADRDDLGGAQVVKVTGDAHGAVTVEELVAAARSPDKARAKYGDMDHRVVLTGKVLGVRPDSFSPSPGRVEFVMTPPGTTPPLVVGVGAFTLERFVAPVKAGQTITVLGWLQVGKDENRFFALALLEAN